jgi:hypothetical protein
MPLSEVDESSGALEVIPGAWREPFHTKFMLTEYSVSWKNQLPASERRSIPLRPGDVVVLDRYIPHRSLPVQHGKARWAVAMWVKAAEA